MADNTHIEWADATLNFINGCEVLSPGCTNCYAMRLAGTRMKHHASRAGLTRSTKAGPVWNGMVTHHLPHLFQALRWRKPRKIFWNAHGDMFLTAVPQSWLDMQFAVMALTPQHTHMLLTKRPGKARAYLADPETPRRVAAVILKYGDKWGISGKAQLAPLGDRTREEDPEFASWPLPNVWLGTSAEDQERADQRIPQLLAAPAARRFLSCEPLLGSVKIRPHWLISHHPERPNSLGNARIDWVIVGGESGLSARPMHPDWARALRDQCQEAGVPFFFKQWGEWFPTSGCDGYTHGPAKNARKYPNSPGLSWLADGRICCRDFTVSEHQRRIEKKEACCTRAVEVDLGALAAFHATLDATSGPINPLGYQWMYRVGKKAAGRLLDGREWSEVPA